MDIVIIDGVAKRRHSPESIAKMSASKIGKSHYRPPHSEETKAKIAASLKGRKGPPCSEEMKMYLSMLYTGQKLSEEHKEKVRQANLGKKASPETKAKISAIHQGRKHTSETIEKMRRNRKGIKPTLEMRLRRKLTCRRGENHPSWKGGISSKNALIRNSIEYRMWRESVFERDMFTCRVCGKKGGKLNAHHIKPFASYPELRFDINNGMTHCVPCHKKTDSYAGKCKKNYKK